MDLHLTISQTVKSKQVNYSEKMLKHFDFDNFIALINRKKPLKYCMIKHRATPQLSPVALTLTVQSNINTIPRSP